MHDWRKRIGLLLEWIPRTDLQPNGKGIRRVLTVNELKHKLVFKQYDVTLKAALLILISNQDGG